jgi:hypothetical protein
VSRKKKIEVVATAPGEPLPPSDVNGSGDLQSGNDGGADDKSSPVFAVGPIATDSNTSVSAKVWASQHTDRRDGRTMTVYSVSVHALCRDTEGNWIPCKTVRGSHLYALIYCLQRASEWILAQRDPAHLCPI